MTISQWSFPTTIVFGPGAIAHTGPWARKLGGARALLVADRGVVAAGLAERLAAHLRGCDLHVAIFDGVQANPTEDDVAAGLERYRGERCDVVIGLGGGAPLDVAKAIRLLVTHAPPLAQYDDAIDGGSRIRPDLPPYLALPTTAGTGSEVGRSTVIALRATGRKTVIFAPPLIASVAICDPELTVSMPPRVTAATGMDALTHGVEAYLATGEHPLCDAIAIDCVRRAAAALPRAVERGDDLEARGEMMKAALMGAVAFQKGLGACHALAHPLSNVCGLHHGLANALMLPAVLDFNAEGAPVALAGRLAAVAMALGQPGLRAGDAVRLLRERIGLPARLSEAGVREDQIAAMVAQAVEDASHRSNPRACTAADFERLYRASW